jgi:hypothetical protein
MEASDSSETLVAAYYATLCHNPVDHKKMSFLNNYPLSQITPTKVAYNLVLNFHFSLRLENRLTWSNVEIGKQRDRLIDTHTHTHTKHDDLIRLYIQSVSKRALNIQMLVEALCHKPECRGFDSR